MKVFISYGRGDALEFARKLSAWLKTQGFTPWLDVDEGVPLGSPFDLRIELGIEGSDLVIALLSRWSLRPDGFCRNELLFAQAKKRPIIPVRIADVTPPIQIISLNYLDACTNPDAVFHELAAVIRQVTKCGHMTPREWPVVTAGSPWWADERQLDFQEELARHGESFTGREWLFEQIREWITQPASRLLLVTADAGFGKSAVAAQLTARLNVRGVHFCSRSQIESCKPAAWLAGLVYQLAAQFPVYRASLPSSSPDWNQPGESLFRTLIADPLRELAGQLPLTEPWVFVVDALDESVAEAGHALTDLLTDSAERIPDWLRIIVTSRPDQNIVAQFNRTWIWYKHLDAEGTPNLADVSRYIVQEVARLESSGAIARRPGTVERLANLANGNFLFARLTVDALMDVDPVCRLNLDELGTLPAKLGGLYHAMFRKRFRDPDVYEREVLPLLDCLVAARGPVPKDLLRVASGLASQVFQRGLRALSQFLNSSVAGCRLFHQSLADWLADAEASGQFAASRSEGGEKLTVACWSSYQQDPDRMSAYTMRYIVDHLANAERWDDVCHILCDLRFVQARCRDGEVFELISDYRLAWEKLPEAQVQLQEERRRALRVAHWTEETVEYARQWSNRRDRLARGDSFPALEPNLPRTLTSVEPWSNERIDAECQRILQQPSRLDRLRAFAGFVESESYSLLSFGKRQGFVVQHAFNQMPDGPVHQAADCLRRSGGVPYVLRRWSSGAVGNPKPALLQTLEGHGGIVWGVSITPDGRRAVSGSEDTTLRVWDLKSGACLRILQGHGDWVNTVSVSMFGQRAISGSEDTTLRVWDLKSGECVRKLGGHSAGVLSVNVTPDDRHAVSASDDCTLRLWNLENGVCVRTMEGHSDSVRSVSVTPDGRRAVSGSDDRTLRIWDLETGRCLRRLEGHSHWVMSVSVTPDGHRAISGSSDKSIRIWDLESGRCLRILNGHGLRITSVSTTPDGRLAVSGSEDSTLRIWNLESGECLRILEGHSARIWSVGVTPDGRRAISGSSDKSLRIWDLESGLCQPVREGHSAKIWSLSVTPDGQHVVSASEDKTLRVWDLESGACLRTLVGHDAGVKCVCAMPDGRRVISGSHDQTLRLWDLETGNSLRTLTGHIAGVEALSVTPEGRFAASGGRDWGLRVWDLKSGKCLRALDGHTDRILCMRVTPDGRKVISGSSDRSLRVWDLERGVCEYTLEAHHNGVGCLSLTPDGRRVVSGSADKTLRVWDLVTGSCLGTLEGHNNWVDSVSVTPDGQITISSSSDRTLRVWNIQSGQCLAIVTGNTPWVAASHSAVRNCIIAGTSTGELAIFDMVGFLTDLAICTVVSDSQTAGSLATRCPCCGKQFIVSDTIVSHMAEPQLNQSPYANLPASAFSDPRLLSACPHCSRPLKFNPFLVEAG